MKIYTKRGDEGQTDLFGGERVSKNHVRVRAYGAIDAANSALGFVLSSKEVPLEIANLLPDIMSDLFDIGAELATAPTLLARQKLEKMMDSKINTHRISDLETYIDLAESKLPDLKCFVLPTGSESAARFHLARTFVRQAEQEIIALQESGELVRAEIIAFVNRLSDLMFVWARFCNFVLGIKDVSWRAR